MYTSLLAFLVGIVALATASQATPHFSNLVRQTPTANNSGYVLQKGPLDTPWTSTVGTSPWPEYPRPQLSRAAAERWLNLNGVWAYQNATQGFAELARPPFGQELERAVLVPFCLESALSGILGNWTIYSWYRTTFSIPSSWNPADRVMLNFGAVDYNATVFVNGVQVANNIGGFWSFDVDVTDALSANGTNELVLFVFDPTNLYGYQIPVGKQKLIPEHIFYTPCSGIWQTVWLESVPSEHVTSLAVNAEMSGQVNVTVTSSAPNSTTPIAVSIYQPNSSTLLQTVSGTANTPLAFTIASPSLWSPDSPTLYNLSISLGSDTVTSYTAFRTFSKAQVDGYQRPLLNGEPVFLFGTLDQGYWPDGILTPPSYEAMMYDLNLLKSVGFNMLRKHIKIEPALYYQAADQLGLMIIQDMPSLPTSYVDIPAPPCPDACAPPDIDSTDIAPDWQARFNDELARMVTQLSNVPSIVAWVIYNEGWGQDGTNDIPLTDTVRTLNTQSFSRLIDSTSGWYDHGAGDFSDNHHYSSPQCGTPFYSDPSTAFDDTRIAFQGEFGGLGNNVSIENAWNVPLSLSLVKQTYELDATIDVWNARAHTILLELATQITDYGACSGAVWTQTTDVEGEVNGLVTYDRRVVRVDMQQWQSDVQTVFAAARQSVGASQGGKGNATLSFAETMVGRGQAALGT